MKVTLHLEGTRQQCLEQVQEFATVLTTSLGSQQPVAGPASAGTKKGPKATKTAEPEAPQADEDETFNFGADESEEEETTDDEIDLDTVLVPAFSAFSKKSDKNKAKAIAILKSYKVKSVRDIPAAAYAEVMKKIT